MNEMDYAEQCADFTMHVLGYLAAGVDAEDFRGLVHARALKLGLVDE